MHGSRLLWIMLLMLFTRQGSLAQENYLEAAVAWLKTDDILTVTQLDQAHFEEELAGHLTAKSYYYIKVSHTDSSSAALPLLLCDIFLQVDYVFHDSLASVRELGWNRNTLPIIIDLPDSLAQQSHFYLRGYNYKQRSFPSFGFYWVSEDYLAGEFIAVNNDRVVKLLLPNALSTGLIVTFIIFFGALFISNPTQKVYLHYILYLIPLGSYLFHRSSYVTYHMFPDLTVKYPFWFIFNDLPIQVIFHVAYIIFTFTFLNAKTDYPLYYRVGRGMIIVGLVYAAIFSIGMYLQPYGSFWGNTFRLERLIISVFSIWANIYVIIYRKDRIALIVASGSLIFLLGAWGSFFYNMNVMRLGAILEVIFFSLGIGYKLNLERREKDQIKTALIDQLRETEVLQKRYSTELEKEVKVRSEELVEKAKQVEEEKKQKMRAQLERKVEEMKTIAMRSQMNPHFLFNSLNSIRHLIITHKTTEAYDYLSEFASLMRSVLENAEEDAISLKSELAVIRTYIALEKLRFKDDFTFRLSVSDEVMVQELLVPPLIIQPFLENAIIHGLAPKKADKLLILDIQIKNDRLVVKVEDNGLGRDKLPGKLSIKKNKPMAMNIAKERLDLFVSHHLPDQMLPANIRIEDKKDASGAALGTIVFIELPVIKV